MKFIPYIRSLIAGAGTTPLATQLVPVQSFREHSRLIGALRWFLLMLVGLLAVHAVEAETYNWKPVVIKGGGFVTGIVPHPNASGLMYCRTDIGGAYRWNATNGSWIPLLDFLGYPNEEWSLNGVESIALDPQDPNRLYMTCGWLGAGRPNAVLISTDQGTSFTRVNTSFTMEANSDGRSNGERLAVDPNLGSILFNGTRRDGLWKSVNYGASWSKVTSFPVNTTTNNVGLVFVEFIKSSGVNGSATPEIFVGVSQGGTNIYRSADGGATWTGVTHGAASNYMPHRAAQDGLGNMYVTFSDAPGPNGVSAGSVRKFNITTLDSTDVTPSPSGQGGFAGVSVDKQNPNTVVVSTIDRWWPGDEVYRSTNGGTNWTAIYSSATIDASSAPWIKWGGATAGVPHWIGDIKIDPLNSNRVYHISGGGVYSSYNLTATTPSWQFRSDGIEETGLWSGGSSLCSPPSGPLLFTALGDIGGFAPSNPDISPPETDHFNPVYGSHTSVDFAELNPSMVVRTHWGSPRGGRSTDSGRTWTDFATHPTAADSNPGVIAISADGGRLVWQSPGSPASYSTNNGATWNVCGGSITPASWELPYLCSDRVNGSKFYLYIPSTAVVHISTDGGASFSAGPTLGYWGNNLRAVYGYEGHVWMASEDGNAANGGLWRSTNSGASFTKLGGIQRAKSIGFGRTASGSGYPVIYLHGQVNNTWGIFRSENQGTNWTRINDANHQFGWIAQVTGDPKIYGRCYVGTSGRGVLYGDMPNLPPLAPILTATASNAAVSLTWNAVSGADSYMVKRATVSGGPYTNIASGVTATSFTDTGRVNGTAYYYVVSATNVYGVSPDSTEASATPIDARALYAFESNAQDSSGVGNHGTATAVSYVTGKVGAQAAEFNGTSSYVSIPRSVTDDFTVAMWVNTTDTSVTVGDHWWTGKALVDGEVWGGAADWGTAIVNGKFVLGVGSWSGDVTIASSVNINDGNWHHVAATRNNTSGAMQVYVDGVLSSSGTGPTGSRTAPPNLRIGSLQVGGNFLNGTLDDVRLYDRILSDGDVQALAAGQLPPPQNVAAAPGDSQIALSWDVVAGATGYTIQRAADSGGSYSELSTGVSDPSYMDTGLADGETWHYQIVAQGFAGDGETSASVFSTTYTAVENWRSGNFGTTANTGNAADSADPDGDGWTNEQEFISGTDPNNRSSLLKIDPMQASGNNMNLTFPSVLGRAYRVERSETMFADSWITVQDNIPGTGGPIQVTDTGGSGHEKRFYRIVVW